MYEAFLVEDFDNGQIVKVTINRPKALNAMNPKFFTELETIFTELNKNEKVRVCILTGAGRTFTSGLDLKEFGGLFSFEGKHEDGRVETARSAVKLYGEIRAMQRQFLSVLKCRVPVIVAMHGVCVGGGVDLACMADIRYATKDCKFTIKEIDIGMAADLGTLQLFPYLSKSESFFRQLAFTGRFAEAAEVKDVGFVSEVYNSQSELLQEAMKTARTIASKSPVAIYTIKQVVNRQILKKVEESLQYMARVNSAMLFTTDTTDSIMAFLSKKKPVYAKL